MQQQLAVVGKEELVGVFFFLVQQQLAVAG